MYHCEPVTEDDIAAAIPGFSPSGAEKRDRELYTNGLCHVFALAMSRTRQADFIAVIDPHVSWWQDEFDADDQVSAVVHVYAVVAGVAYDICGSRPVDEILHECSLRYAASVFSYLEEWSVDDIMAHSGDEDRCPLRPIDERAIERAAVIAATLPARNVAEMADEARPSLTFP